MENANKPLKEPRLNPTLAAAFFLLATVAGVFCVKAPWKSKYTAVLSDDTADAQADRVETKADTVISLTTDAALVGYWAAKDNGQSVAAGEWTDRQIDSLKKVYQPAPRDFPADISHLYYKYFRLGYENALSGETAIGGEKLHKERLKDYSKYSNNSNKSNNNSTGKR